MTEMAKTVIFLAAAAGSLLAAFAIGPGSDNFDVEELVGERLNQFEIEAAKRMKIVKYDNETASSQEFEVAENDGLWSIPSKQGYPADAVRQMGEAATCLVDREILRVAANSASEHQELGVIDPSSANLDSKAEGVGTRVVMTDANDNKLVDMVIGLPVKDAEGQHYVRNTDQDVVYVVDLDPDKLSTNFEDWIEDDLLKLNPLDIRRVFIKDYSAGLQPILTANGIQMQVNWDRRDEMTLAYDNSDSKWHPDRLQEFNTEQKAFVDFELAEDEVLNEDALRELRNGLDDLLIVDVERKPDGLSSDLKAGSGFLNNNEAINSLVERGFAPISAGEDAESEILSSEGELTCTLQDGVEYVLRFGNLKMDGQAATKVEESAEGEAEKSSGAGIHRYLFVMARFNEEAIERPELDELPELPEESAKAEPTSAGGDAAEEEEQDAEKTTETEGEDASDETTETEEAETATETEDASNEEDAKDLEAIIADRKRIETENQRKLDDYQKKIESGKERVQELNDRFGDWYYVISNDVYKQIHLSRDQVIKKKEKEEGEEGADENAEGSTDDILPGLPNLPVSEADSETE